MFAFCWKFGAFFWGLIGLSRIRLILLRRIQICLCTIGRGSEFLKEVQRHWIKNAFRENSVTPAQASLTMKLCELGWLFSKVPYVREVLSIFTYTPLIKNGQDISQKWTPLSTYGWSRSPFGGGGRP